MSAITPLYCKTQRDSNLELLRILSMLAIIAHHYVVNSTVSSQFNYENTSTQQYFLKIWGLWGKTAINSFILISGYFLCRMKLTLQRYLKLVVEVMFYGILIMLIFALTGYEPLTVKNIVLKISEPLRGINAGFTASFLCFYAFVPFYNKLIDHCSRRELLWLVSGLLLIMSGCACFLKAHQVMSEPLWYMTMYFVAAYIRIYPNKYTESLKLSGIILITGIVIAIAINISSIYLSNATGDMRYFHWRHYFLFNSNMPLAFIIGLSSFLTFKNLPKFYNRTINFLAAGTFAVLLIHASSDTMRRWLWQDVCNVPDMLYAPMWTLILQALAVPLLIYLACSSVDYFRRRFIEGPLFKRLRQRQTQIGAV